MWEAWSLLLTRKAGKWSLWPNQKRIGLPRDMVLPMSLVTLSDFILPSYQSFFHNEYELSFLLLSGHGDLGFQQIMFCRRDVKQPNILALET